MSSKRYFETNLGSGSWRFVCRCPGLCEHYAMGKCIQTLVKIRRADLILQMAGPLSDSHGNATFTFLTSISRAFRFNMEPEAIDDDIWILLFGNDTAGEDTQQ